MWHVGGRNERCVYIYQYANRQQPFSSPRAVINMSTPQRAPLFHPVWAYEYVYTMAICSSQRSAYNYTGSTPIFFFWQGFYMSIWRYIIYPYRTAQKLFLLTFPASSHHLLKWDFLDVCFASNSKLSSLAKSTLWWWCRERENLRIKKYIITKIENNYLTKLQTFISSTRWNGLIYAGCGCFFKFFNAQIVRLFPDSFFFCAPCCEGAELVHHAGFFFLLLPVVWDTHNGM